MRVKGAEDSRHGTGGVRESWKDQFQIRMIWNGKQRERERHRKETRKRK
jgi:hypothetical protein